MTLDEACEHIALRTNGGHITLKRTGKGWVAAVAERDEPLGVSRCAAQVAPLASDAVVKLARRV